MSADSDGGKKADPGRDRDAAIGVGRPAREPEAPTGAVNADGGAELRARDVAVELARSLYDDRCTDVLVLDVRSKSQVTDFLVIGTGTSSTQIGAAAHNAQRLAHGMGFKALHEHPMTRDQSWIVVDLVDLVVHVFDDEKRGYYDLEMLWGDAERVAWARPGDNVHAGGTALRNRAGLTPEDETEPGA